MRRCVSRGLPVLAAWVLGSCWLMAQDPSPEFRAPSLSLTDDITEDKDWSIEVGSGIGFGNVRVDDGANTTAVPVHLTASLRLDYITLDGEPLGGILRGYSEFFFRGTAAQVIWGQENRLLGVSFGPRYNFVQPGWKLVPFVEAGVGFYFADSNPEERPGAQRQDGLGQDFNFMFSVAMGARYDITEEWFVRAQANFIHVSNAGLSEPSWLNKPIDTIGPEVSLGYRF